MTRSEKIHSHSFTRSITEGASLPWRVNWAGGLLVLIVLLLLAPGSLAQENVRFTQGEVNDSATLSLSVPLHHYPGRGIDLPVSLSYSSSVWSMEHLAKVNATGSVPQSIVEAFYAKHSKAGWRSGLDLPVVEFPKFNDVYSYAGKPSTITEMDTGCYGYRIPRVFVHMPDGSTHELRKSDTPHSLGYVETSGTFHAVDGSRMRYDGVDEDTGTIYLPDGTQYYLNNGDATITDRHGNVINYDPSTRKWTDTLGREIANPLPATPTVGTTQYSLLGLAGVNNSLITYTFKWEELDDALTTASDLRYIAKHYLPSPGSAPTDHGGANYPQQQSTTYGHLFHSEYVYDLGDSDYSDVPTMVVGRGQSQGALFNPVVLTEIALPDGSKYEFSYNVYGEIDKVVYPTTAYERFEYESPEAGMTAPYGGEVGSKEPYVQAERRMKSREVSANGAGTDLVEWNYEFEYPSKTTIVAPDGTETEVHRQYISDYPAVKWGYTDTRKGMVVQRKSSSSTGGILRREMQEYEQSTNSFNLTDTCQASSFTTPVVAHRNPRAAKSVSILFEGSGSALAQASTFGYDTTYEYSTGVDQTSANTYHYAVVSNTSSSDTAQAGTISQVPTGTLAKTVETTYSSNSTYRATKHILGLPTVVKVKDAGGTVVSQSEMGYDGGGYVPTGSINAMPTTMRTWDSTKGSVTNPNAYLTTHATFDQYGNRTVATDAKGFSTTTTYDSTHHAYPVSVTSPVPDDSVGEQHGSTAAFTTSTSYDAVTGLVLSTTDANGQTTSISYVDPTNTSVGDPLLRPRKVTAPNGHQTITEYGAGTSESTRWVKVRAQIDSTTWSEAKSFYDGLGRTYKTQKTDAAGDVYTVTEYDTMGRVKATSNPFRNVANPSCDTNLECTRPEYDALSRTKKITSPDTDDVQISYGLSTSGTIGTTKTITDQAGKKRKGITDALGNMIQVIEDPDGQNLATDYLFDTLGNLLKTTQVEGTVTQRRFFHYDSLGRLLRAKQPEQDTRSALALPSPDPITNNNDWSVAYTYDDNGNILTTTDANGTTITATYDRLNRIETRNYPDSTPDVWFYYDGKYLDAGDVAQTATGSVKGKTTGVKSSVSRTNYVDFDAMGRLEASQQITDGQTYNFEYAYNLSGALIEETYPSGRKVQNVLDAEGRLEMVKSRKNANSGYWAYANNVTYDAGGAATKMQLGNGLWETAAYDEERLQVRMLGLGTTETTQNLLKLEFAYTTTTTSADNNGSMREQKITVPAVGANPAFTAIQTYTYDDLNRLKSAEEKISSVTKWKQTFKYDRFGNRRFDTTNSGDTTTLGSCAQKACNPFINTSDNRMQEHQDGDNVVDYDYDENGALTKDATGQRFGYDAESHQKEYFSASNSSSTPDATYHYDGDGRRVKKIVGMEVTIFIYNASGQLAAEYSTTIEATTTAQVSYLTTDHLGSPRVVTDKNGGVISRKDFTAFGEEATSTERTSGTAGNGYDLPKVRPDYTGYQKDAESGLEFAQARHYNAQHGRFTGVDPLTASIKTSNPQSFNRYTYAYNDPYKYVDPSGLMTKQVCGAQYSSCSSGDGNLAPSDNVVVRLHIVYDKNQYTLEQAQKALKATVDDLVESFAAIGISFDITYGPGTGSSSRDSAGVPDKIETGAQEGALNVFFFANQKYSGASGSAYNTSNKQIFIWEGSSDASPKAKNVVHGLRSGALAHEVGHAFLDFAGVPFTGTLAGNVSQDAGIEYSLGQMRYNPFFYKDRDLPDNFDYDKDVMKGGVLTGGIRMVARKTKLNPTTEQLFRIGAKRIRSQRN